MVWFISSEESLIRESYKFSIPNLAISSIIGKTFSPNGVMEYSTLGGTSGYCFFFISPLLQRNFSSSISIFSLMPGIARLSSP